MTIIIGHCNQFVAEKGMTPIHFFPLLTTVDHGTKSQLNTFNEWLQEVLLIFVILSEY